MVQKNKGGKNSLGNSLKFISKLILFLIIYFIIGKIGLQLAFLHPSASPVWPATGLAIAGLFILGLRFWPAILVGAFLVNFTTETSISSSLGIAVGNMVEGLFGAYCIKKCAGGNSVLDTPKKISIFLLITAIASLLSATIGTLSLSLGGFLNQSIYFSTWSTWWLGNFLGAIVVFPLILSWNNRFKFNVWGAIEGIIAMFFLIAIALLVFTQWSPFAGENYPLQFVCIIPLLWVALRLEHRGSTLAVLILSIISIFGTVGGYGPFNNLSPNSSLIFLQLYIGVVAVTGLTLSSLIKNKKRD